MDYKVYRNRGLYLNGEMVAHADLELEANEKGITSAELHKILVEKISNKQLDKQRKLSRCEIFEIIRERLDAFTLDPYTAFNKIPDLLADEILTVCDGEGLALLPDSYGSLVIPSRDTTLADRNVIASLFASLTEGLDLQGFNISGVDIRDTVLKRYHFGS